MSVLSQITVIYVKLSIFGPEGPHSYALSINTKSNEYFSKINIYSFFNNILGKLGPKSSFLKKIDHRVFRPRVAMATKIQKLT